MLRDIRARQKIRVSRLWNSLARYVSRLGVSQLPKPQKVRGHPRAQRGEQKAGQ